MRRRIVIVGGVAGGATAAARARRLDESAEIIVFERDEYVSFANCGLPYYIGGEIKNREDLLVATPEMLAGRYNIDVRTSSEVLRIDRQNKRVEVQNLKTGGTYAESYDKLILSPGATPVKPRLAGIGLESIFTLRNIPDTDRMRAYVDGRRPGTAVVVGGGFIGLEMTEQLVHRGVRVTVVEMLDQVMPPIDYEMAMFVHAHMREKGVELRLGDGVNSFSEAGGKTVVTTRSGAEIACDMVVLSIGVKPESALAREAGLELGDRGGIRTNDRMQTSDPDIYAVGDAVEVMDPVSGAPAMIPLGGPANKQGRIAADNALGRDSTYSGTQGTAVVRVFDLTVASTGNSEKMLKGMRRPYLVSYTHSGSHASYYPGSQMLAIKLIFDPHGGKVLGAQVVGMDGVDKRIDVIATAIRAGMTVYDLEELELAYAPPFGSAKDPVNIAGYVASNMLKGDVENVNWHEIEELRKKDDHVLLDVRTQEEIAGVGTIEDSLHIPINELRSELSRLDKTKTYIPFCSVGLRAYVGHRILVQNGFKSKNLSGGYRTFNVATMEG
jgi:NADPH-dependent 2,4-dienoyl-CoA reductase/sulfur reductase-like enzyme/rhodanese-related sulfurtransferase